MTPIVRALLACVASVFRSRVSLQLEIVALRHQLALCQRSIRRPHVRPGDRILWSGLSRGWSRWRGVLVFVQPATVLAWQRKRFRDHWARRSRKEPGRPAISQKVRALIREISGANPRWGAPRILGESRKLGIPVAKSTGEKYRVRPRRPASPAWRAFLENHLTELVAVDFVAVPAAGFKVLFVLVILARERRKILHFKVTAHPTAQRTAQLLVEAVPWETVSTYLLRERDAVYRTCFHRRAANLGIDQILTAPRSPWQDAYAERMIRSIRRECLEHVVVFSDGHLRRLLPRYFHYYHRWWTHLWLWITRTPVRTPA